MERPTHDALPTLTADTDRLRRELEQLYASVKASGTERPAQARGAKAVGMVIKGK